MTDIQFYLATFLQNHSFRLSSPIITDTETVTLRTNPTIKPAARREECLPLPPSAAEAEQKNEKARQETEALLHDPKAKRYSRDEFVQWVDEA